MNEAQTSKRMKDTSRKLPDGWRWVKLGEVCEVVGGSTPETGNPAYWDGEIVWVTPTDLGKLSDVKISTTDRRITFDGLQSCGAEMLPVGTVVMSSRAPIGHLAIAGAPLCTNQGCKSFIANDEVDDAFLYWTLKHAVPDIRTLGSGATFAEVSKTSLQQFKICLPSLPEQRRIATTIREQMAAVDKARAAAQARLEAVKALPAAYLRQVFPEPGQLLPDGWYWGRLGELCKRIRNGITATQIQDIAGLPVTRIETISSGEIDATRMGRIAGPIDNLSEYVLALGDVLFSHINSVERLGNCAIYRGEPEQLIHGMNLLRMEPLTELMLSEFLLWSLRSDSAIAFYRRNARRAIGQASLNTKDISVLPLPVPPISKQRHILEMLKVQMTSTEKLRAAAEAELEAINALPGALLRRAFAGEL